MILSAVLNDLFSLVLAQKVHPLLGFFPDGVYVGCSTLGLGVVQYGDGRNWSGGSPLSSPQF